MWKNPFPNLLSATSLEQINRKIQPHWCMNKKLALKSIFDPAQPLNVYFHYVPNILVNEGNSVLTGKSRLWTMKMQRFPTGTKSFQLQLKGLKGSLSLKMWPLPYATTLRKDKHSSRKWLQLKSGSHECAHPRHPTGASSNTQLSLKAACLIPASAVALVKNHQGTMQWRVSPEQSAD